MNKMILIASMLFLVACEEEVKDLGPADGGASQDASAEIPLTPAEIRREILMAQIRQALEDSHIMLQEQILQIKHECATGECPFIFRNPEELQCVEE
jgi:hypothetical protein